jgi:amino acid permease
MWKIMSLLLSISIVLGSCTTAPESIEFRYTPHTEAWLYAFENGYLTEQQFLTLVKGAFAVQKMEALKITGYRQKNSMSALARKTKEKVDKAIREGE